MGSGLEIATVNGDTGVETTGRPLRAGGFLARIKIPKEEREKLEGKRHVPGMPADVHIRTGDRTVLSYLVKPVLDQMEQAFRER